MGEALNYARTHFEKVLSSFRSSENFREAKSFQDSLDAYHRTIATEFAYDFEGFVDYFFTNSRRNAGFKLLGWYKDKFLNSVQKYLKKTEISSWLHDYYKTFTDEKNLLLEVKLSKEYFDSLMIESLDTKLLKTRKEYSARIAQLENDILACQNTRAITFNLLSQKFSEKDIIESLAEREILIEEEKKNLESVVLGKTVLEPYVIKNPILKEIHDRKYGLVVCSGNFFGKSVILSVLSLWALLCHTNMVVRNIVSKSQRETTIKSQLLNSVEQIMDGVILENGVDSNIFHYLFRSNVNEVYKADIFAKSTKESAAKYSTKWLWYTSYAKDSTDTKGQRNKNFIMIFDEASEIPSETITGAITNVNRDFDALNFIIMCGNPNQRAGEGVNEFFKYLYTPEKYAAFFDVYRLTEKDLDTSILKSNALINYLTQTEGVDSPVFRERVLGEIVQTDALFSSREIESIFLSRKEPIDVSDLIVNRNCRDVKGLGWAQLCDFCYNEDVVVGIDPAGSTGGVDSFGIALRRTNALGFVTGVHKEANVYNLIGHIWKACASAKSVTFAVDINGVGAYFCQVLSLKLGIPDSKFLKFFGHNYHDSVQEIEKDGFRDNYAIFTMRMILWLKKHQICQNEQLKSEMSQLVWHNQNSSKRKINKEDFIKKMRKSPDLFDAFNASFAKNLDKKTVTKIGVKKTSNMLSVAGVI